MLTSMVQIKQWQEKSPRAGSTFRFWRRVKVRVRRQRQPLQKSFSSSGKTFKDTESEDGQSGALFGLQRVGRRTKKRFLSFAHNWTLLGTGRWLRLARSRILLRGDARTGWTVNGRKREKDYSEGNVLTGLSFGAKCHKQRSWGVGKQGGKVNVATWMNGKGSSSIRAPLIEQNNKDDGGIGVDVDSKGKSSIDEGYCGCSGGMIWRSREKCRREVLESDESEGQEDENAGAGLVDQAVLPDDILEMCLARTPFAALLRARAVCKKWKSLTLSPHFLQLRESIRSWDPWLFLFGLSRDGVCLGQIQALDPASSKWHTIKADILTGRLSYSVTAVNGVIYIVGGCSSSLLKGSERIGKDSVKTIKTVLMYTPLTGSWRKMCPLTTERAAPIVGAFRLEGSRITGGDTDYRHAGHSNGTLQLNWASDLHGMRSSSVRGRVFERGSRHGGELAVYGGSETQGREVDALGTTDGIAAMKAFADLNKGAQQESCRGFLGAEFKKLCIHGSNTVAKGQRKFGLIAVGGQGIWNEQLYSAEIYDPVTDNWREVASLPADHGTACAGVVCKNFFYVYSDSNKLAAYDLEREAWHSVRVSQAPARLLDYTPKLVSCQDRVFLLGVDWGMIADGGSEMATRKIWELYQEPTSTGWVKVSQHPDAPLDWNAVFVADEEVIFGVEMFRIFGQMLDFVTICKIARSGAMAWERVSRMEMATHAMDPSSCLTKTAIVARL